MKTCRICKTEYPEDFFPSQYTFCNFCNEERKIQRKQMGLNYKSDNPSYAWTLETTKELLELMGYDTKLPIHPQFEAKMNERIEIKKLEKKLKQVELWNKVFTGEP